MSFLVKFLNAVRLNDDYDDDDQFFDEEEDLEDDDPIVEEAPLPEEREEKPKSRFFRKMTEDEEEEAPQKVLRTEPRAARTSRTSSASVPVSSKVTPMRRQPAAVRSEMEVSVIRPTTMENTREIADTLLSSCTVVLNLEGIDVELAQRIIDFACGTCYAIEGSLQKVSSYIFILTPSNVEISGDIQDILNGGIPAIRSGFEHR